MKRWHLATLIAPALLLSGCVIPIHIALMDWPAMDGKVVDGVTGKPIAGAALEIHSAWSDASAKATTAADGTFHLPRQTHDGWKSFDYPEGKYPPPLISVTAPGHYPFAQRLDAMAPDAIALAPSQ